MGCVEAWVVCWGYRLVSTDVRQRLKALRSDQCDRAQKKESQMAWAGENRQFIVPFFSHNIYIYIYSQCIFTCYISQICIYIYIYTLHTWTHTYIYIPLPFDTLNFQGSEDEVWVLPDVYVQTWFSPQTLILVDFAGPSSPSSAAERIGSKMCHKGHRNTMKDKK